MPRFNAFSRTVNTINLFFSPTHHDGIYKKKFNKKENSTSILEKDKTLRSLRKYKRVYPRCYPWRIWLVNNKICHFVSFKLGIKIFLKISANLQTFRCSRKFTKFVLSFFKQKVSLDYYSVSWEIAFLYFLASNRQSVFL